MLDLVEEICRAIVKDRVKMRRVLVIDTSEGEWPETDQLARKVTRKEVEADRSRKGNPLTEGVQARVL
jgi:hypothetical protein